MRGARPRREGNFGDPPLPLSALPERRRAAPRGTCASPGWPADPRAVCALPFPLSLGFAGRRFSTFCNLFPSGRHPQIHTRPPSPPLRAGPRCRGCPAGRAPLPSRPRGTAGGGGGTNRPRPAPRRDAVVCAVHTRVFMCPHMCGPRRRGRGAAQPRTTSILPPPLRLHPELLPAPDLNTSRAPCSCRAANRLEFGARFAVGASWRWSLPPLSLPSPGSRQSAGGGHPALLGSHGDIPELDTGRKTSRGAGKSRQQRSGVPVMYPLGTHKIKSKGSEEWSLVQRRDLGALQSKKRAKLIKSVKIQNYY